MIIVYTPGVWDLLHVGHVRFLEAARRLGDRLVVGVPTDEVVVEDKGCPPVIPHCDRVEMVRSLRCVDVVLPYFQLEFLNHLRMVDPDIIVLGSTWGSEPRHKELEVWVSQNNRRIIMLPRTHGISTTLIRKSSEGRLDNPLGDPS